jgi:hypothetical protein
VFCFIFKYFFKKDHFFQNIVNVKATSDVGFKAVLSDPEIAKSLVNGLFKSIHLNPIYISKQGQLEISLQGHGSFAAMDYHAITTKGNTSSSRCR